MPIFPVWGQMYFRGVVPFYPPKICLWVLSLLYSNVTLTKLVWYPSGITGLLGYDKLNGELSTWLVFKVSTICGKPL